MVRVVTQALSNRPGADVGSGGGQDRAVGIRRSRKNAPIHKIPCLLVDHHRSIPYEAFAAIQKGISGKRKGTSTAHISFLE